MIQEEKFFVGQCLFRSSGSYQKTSRNDMPFTEVIGKFARLSRALQMEGVGHTQKQAEKKNRNSNTLL